MVYLYSHPYASKQMLERDLGLSLPTISQNLRDLESQGLISQGGQLQSTGGRRPISYRFEPTSRLALGVKVGLKQTNICAIGLHGDIVDKRQFKGRYRNTDGYFTRLNAAITSFVRDQEQGGSKVLGVAFAVHGLISSDGASISFGKILNNTGLTLETISQGLDLPSMIIHEADASAMAELWFDPDTHDAVCIYLEDRPGGAIIVNGKLYQGPNLCNGTIGHMRVVPGGELCYCGQRGCMDCYCSPDYLLGPTNDPSHFFKSLRKGDQEETRRFDRC
ncbi:ROK family transcriptional regulator [Bifidobacterium aemilianum]|uniref:ROK family transcriptional regulator n=1 Tax=Bifidobacterium aemilianum TaxID=2493120 RepID=UPI001F1C368B|nr:ROK family transcriptional regulator [Bifidobacterium aemilianum]